MQNFTASGAHAAAPGVKHESVGGKEGKSTHEVKFLSPILGHGCREGCLHRSNLPNAQQPPHHLCSQSPCSPRGSQFPTGFPVLTLTLRLGFLGSGPYSFTGSMLERAVLGEKGLSGGAVRARGVL